MAPSHIDLAGAEADLLKNPAGAQALRDAVDTIRDRYDVVVVVWEELRVAGRVTGELGRFPYQDNPGPCVVLLAGLRTGRSGGAVRGMGAPRRTARAPPPGALLFRWRCRDALGAELGAPVLERTTALVDDIRRAVTARGLPGVPKRRRAGRATGEAPARHVARRHRRRPAAPARAGRPSPAHARAQGSRGTA